VTRKRQGDPREKGPWVAEILAIVPAMAVEIYKGLISKTKLFAAKSSYPIRQSQLLCGPGPAKLVQGERLVLEEHEKMILGQKSVHRKGPLK
jgi:hypothetical protein